MIEIKLVTYTTVQEGMVLMANILKWLFESVAGDTEGVLWINNKKEERLLGLVMCNGAAKSKVLIALDGRPGEFKGKYVARSLTEEPTVVEEMDADEVAQIKISVSGEEKEKEEEDVPPAVP